MPKLHTSEIQSKIDTCHAQGGGVVRLPKGTYYSASLQLKSGVILHLEKGAEIIGVNDVDLYPILAPTVNESSDIRALIYAEGATDIGIEGQGIINGGAPRPLDHTEGDKEPTRPELIFLRDCKNVSVKDCTLRDSAFWTLHLMHCEDVTIDNVYIRNRKDRINTDGIDPDGCKRVRITNCDIITGDDCIVLKSTEGGHCEDVFIQDCLLETDCAALKLGTESLGSIRNVNVSNCTIKGSKMAFGVFMKDGGLYEDIQVSNLNIEDQTEFPLFIDSEPRFHGKSTEGIVRNISLQNITIKSPGRLFINGSPKAPIENIRINGLQWTITGHLKLGSLGKPAGSVRRERDPDGVRHEYAKSQFTLANIKGFILNDVQIQEDRPPHSPDRSLLYTANIEEPNISLEAFTNINWLPEEKSS